MFVNLLLNPDTGMSKIRPIFNRINIELCEYITSKMENLNNNQLFRGDKLCCTIVPINYKFFKHIKFTFNAYKL